MASLFVCFWMKKRGGLAARKFDRVIRSTGHTVHRYTQQITGETSDPPLTKRLHAYCTTRMTGTIIFVWSLIYWPSDDQPVDSDVPKSQHNRALRAITKRMQGLIKPTKTTIHNLMQAIQLWKTTKHQRQRLRRARARAMTIQGHAQPRGPTLRSVTTRLMAMQLLAMASDAADTVSQPTQMDTDAHAIGIDNRCSACMCVRTSLTTSHPTRE